jgi:hypothetical protein
MEIAVASAVASQVVTVALSRVPYPSATLFERSIAGMEVFIVPPRSC